ncbi:MAG: iron-containing alcohol dehydrogenase [Verrucomicrobia bacterium]|nr:iron-containing alcohol dehydrogenase [Verrucomicrobiota bacterium]MBU4290353.1 iron-containing alcohol dehydrogenase [Verrucomicrobiota bacterium]MBU4430197.1 iron-containing alcohol dehydrogenase [Verrucomicrobiota bacterium]MCG2681483.1 iron-containing alcohol dehydrogenase [Kiritimatiellia bacterium]
MNLFPNTIVFPARTLTGAGVIARLLAECVGFGRRGIIVHGHSLVKHGVLARILQATPAGCQVKSWEHTGGEPTLKDLDCLLTFAREHRADWVAGVGGGSVLDLAKACAGLYLAAETPLKYHQGAPLETRGIPFIAAPTTAGTGSEATINSVLTDPDTRVKKSIRDPMLIARLVLLDPDLLAHCPKSVIAHSGMDAFTQAVEAYTSRHASWMSDTFALKGVELIAANLEAVYREGTIEQCQGLLAGSYLAGLGFSMGRLGVVHGLAHPLGFRYHVPHGLVCGVCLPYAIELNRDAMGVKYESLSRAIGADLLTWTLRMLECLQMASPFKGKAIIEKATIIKETLPAWSTQANPKPITPQDVEWLLSRLF